MECPACGARCAAGARFCWSCGQPVRVPSEERRIVTVLFADLVGFTTLSEHLDPEQVKRLVDHAFERLVRDVTAFGGRVDKIVGDAIVALFGAPVAHEDDAERAVRAALRMQETLAAYAGERDADIRMRIGVNTGEVLVGALRAGGDYTAMGDVVNTASRLQSLADPGEVLVGENTRGATGAAIAYEPRGAVVPRGRERALDVWSAVGVLRPPGYRPHRHGTPLIGRDREMDVLTNALEVSVRHGRGQVVLLLGEAGVGKTRLAAELAEVAAVEHAATCLSGRCVPYGEANPWWPVAEVLRSGCGVGHDDPLEEARAQTTRVVEKVDAAALVSPEPTDGDGSAERLASTTSVVDGLLHLMGYDGPLRGLDGGRARIEATRALISFLEASVRRGPIVVRLSDLHWADQPVLDLVDEVAEQLARHPFVLVATARRSLQERWTPRLGRFNSLVLNVDALDRGSSALLLDTLVGTEIDDGARSTLLDRSGGNPFYLEELATLLGRRPLDDDGSAAVSVEALPDTLRGLVAARIDGLDPEEQQVLEDASVWGASGGVHVLDRVAAAMRDVHDVGPVVRRLADKDVLVLDEDEWSFRSDLVREVTYARLTKRERLVRHLGIAEYVERALAGRPCDDATVDTIAHHLVVAARLRTDLGMSTGPTDLVARAVRWTAEAARRAEQDGSWRVADRLFSQALDLVEADPEVCFQCLIGRSRVRAESWDEAGAIDDATAALELARVADEPGWRARALLRSAIARSRSGDVATSDLELDEAIELFDRTGDQQGHAEALRERGLGALLRGDIRGAEAPIASALDAFRSLGDRHGEAWSMQNLAWIALSDGRLDEADAYLSGSGSVFRDLGDPGGTAWVQGLMAFTRLQQGDLGAAGDIASRVLRECVRRGDRFGEAMMLTVRAHVELWHGHTAAASESARQAVEAFRSSSDLSGTVGLEQALSVAGRAAVMSGDVPGGRALLGEASRPAKGTADGTGEGGGFALGVSLVTDVQIGRPERLLDIPLERWVDATGPARTPLQEAVYAVGLAQAGRVDEAALLVRRAVRDRPGSGYVLACLAVVTASAGASAEAVAAADRLASTSDATYLDRVWAHVAASLADAGDAGGRHLARAEVELGPGEDVVAVAMVALAGLVRRARDAGRLDLNPSRPAMDRLRAVVGDPGVEGTEVMALLDEVGMSDTAWADLFVRAATAVDARCR